MNYKLHCKYHPHSPLIEDFVAGDLICAACGLVVGDRVIDFSSEWRSFANDGNGEDSSRVGKTEDSTNAESTTSITIKQSYDSKHLNENGEQKYKNRIAETPVERMLKECRGFVTVLGDRMNLSNNIKNSAMGIVKKLTQVKGFTRKNKQEIACGCLFITCREENIERSLKEISSVSDAALKDITKMVKRICGSLGLASKASNLTDQMSRFCYQLGLKEKFIATLAHAIANESKKFIDSKKPSTIIATSIYMASFLMNEPITKTKLKEIIDVTENTIGATYRTFYMNRTNLVPDNMMSRLKNSLDQLPIS